MANNLEYVESIRLATSGTLAVDVGAYVGNFAFGLSRAVGRTGSVLALEPQPGAYRELLKTTAGRRVTALNAAASDHSGSARMTVPFDANHRPARQRASLATRSPAEVAQTVEVQLVRLDDVISSALPVSLLKIDADGHESQVLAGAQQTITQHRPALVVEIEQRCLGTSSTVADVVSPLLETGYECRCIGRGKRLFPWSEFDLETDQLRWVTPSGDLAPGYTTWYANNFVFTWRGRARETFA
jgi:FkbM family methyltransferase